MRIDISKFTSGITEINKTAEPEEFKSPKYDLSEPLRLSGKVVIEETGQIWLSGTITAKIKQKCDRCLTEYIEVIEKKINLTLSGEVQEEQPEDSYDLFPNDSDIADLTKYISDTIAISLPNKSLCESDCKGICPHCGQNLNEGSCDCEFEEVDPRLEKLKELKNKMED